MCEAPEVVFPDCLVALLPGFFADARLIVEGCFFVAAFDRARGALREDGLGDFMRVFLDIRLPFVAFGGSIMGVLRVLSRQGADLTDCWARPTASEYGYQEFDAPPVPLVECALWGR